MARIDKEHETFIRLTEDQNYREFMKKNAPLLALQFEANLMRSITSLNKNLASFLKWAIQMSKKEFYFLQVPNSDGIFTLTSKDFGSMVYFRYCSSLTEVTTKIIKKEEAIEIVQLHSKIKGSGSKIINEFIKLSKDIQIPLVLYAETDSLVKYYEQYNFINHGKHGNSDEYLLIRIPKSKNKFTFKF